MYIVIEKRHWKAKFETTHRHIIYQQLLDGLYKNVNYLVCACDNIKLVDVKYDVFRSSESKEITNMYGQIFSVFCRIT